MKILAIETSCDDTAIAVLETKPKNSVRVLSNVISSQIKLHVKYGGVFPSLAAREHVKNIDKVLKVAFQEAGLKTVAEVDLIAVTCGPGLMVSLLVGVTFAKSLAWKYKKPLVGVNHLEGHILSPWLKPVEENSKIPVSPTGRQISNFKIWPALCLVVSGGHTELVLMKKPGQYKIIGKTRDDAVGEAFDKVARLLGLGYPGGPPISKLAEKGDPDHYSLPSPMLKSRNYDFSYSGLKTAVLYLIRDLQKNHKLQTINDKLRADIAASFQKAAVEVLVSKTLAAAKELKAKSVWLSGGVSANKLLREELESKITAELPLIQFFQPHLNYTTDNAAMIALAGYLYYLRNKKTDFSWKSVRANANLELWQKILPLERIL